MIGSLKGIVSGLIRDSIVVDVSGVGYRVSVTVGLLAKVKETEGIFLWTHLAVRENSQDLYGFETKEELAWFELLLTVSGIGPKSALAVLNAVDIQTLEKTISMNDPSGLSRAFGIGKKTAEKIVLELRDKVGSIETGAREAGADGEVVDVLIGLGYSTREAREAVRAIPKDITEAEAKIREGIRIASHSH